MDRIAGQVRAGDQVIFTFSGHGAQQPDQNPGDPLDPEPDGLDEVLLPSDAGPRDDTGMLANAPVDDELHAWLKKIDARG